MARRDDEPVSMRLATGKLEALRYRDACAAFAALAQGGGPRVEAHIGWGRALAGLANAEEAAAQFAAALELDPACADAYLALGEVWDQLEAPVALQSTLARRVAAVRTRAAWSAWAGFLAARGQHRQALAAYRDAASLGAGDSKFLASWAETAAAAGQHELALQHLVGSIAAAPDDGAHLFFDTLPQVLRALGSAAGALKQVEDCVDASGSATLRRAWAALLYELGHHDAGAARFAQALSAEPDDAEAWLQWGGMLASAGKADDALAKFERAITLDPGRVTAYGAVGGVLAEVSDPEAAVGRISATVDPCANAVIHGRWGSVLQSLGRHEAAQAHFEAALRLDPTLADQLDRADTLEALGRGSEAAVARLDMLARHPGRGTRRSRSVLLRLLNDGPDEQLQDLQQHVVETGSPALDLTWAELLERAGRRPEALSLIQRSARHHTVDHTLALRRLALLRRLGAVEGALLGHLDLLGRGVEPDTETLDAVESCLKELPAERREDALQRVEDALGRAGQARVLLRWGQILADLRLHEQAIGVLRRAREADPDDSAAALALARSLAATGRHGPATVQIVEAIELGAGEPGTLENALAAFESSFQHLDSDRMLAQVERTIGKVDGARAYRAWGLALGSLERFGGELRQFDKALAKRPNDHALRAERAYRLAVCGRADEALSEHRRAAEARPAEPFPQRIWGLTLERLRRHEEAIEHLQQAHELEDAPGNFFFDWAIALEGLGAPEAATAKYREAIDATTDQVQQAYCQHNIAYILQSQGNYAGARDAWDRALESYDRAGHDEAAPAAMFNYQGYVYLEIMNDLDAAQRCYEKAVALSPDFAAAQAGLALLYLKRLERTALDDHESERAPGYHARAREAAAHARRVLARRLKDLDAAPTRLELGQLHLACSEHDEARACFQRAVELDPDSADAWSLLAKACLRAEDLRAALAAARTAVARGGRSLGHRSVLAEVHQKLGDHAKAETEYRRILSVAPGHVDALMGLGYTFLAMGAEAHKNSRLTDAENMFSRALDQFALVAKFAGTRHGSKYLSPAEEAALAYSRGYACVMRYESQTVAKRDRQLLEMAVSAFDEVRARDANFHKAQRAKARIRERTQAPDPATRWGGWLIVGGALVTLLVANVAFLIGKPGLVRSYQAGAESVEVVKAAKAPADVLARVEALAALPPVPKAAFEAQVKAALGDDLARKLGESVQRQARSRLDMGLEESIESGYYALLTFGALVFVAAGLSLQQMSKLKFGGIELEKTSEAASKAVGSLGVEQSSGLATT